MKILEISWKNFNSYGNSIQKVEFEKEKGDLFLLLGSNGHGKCLSPETEVEVEIEDTEVNAKFLKFMQQKRSFPSPL